MPQSRCTSGTKFDFEAHEDMFCTEMDVYQMILLLPGCGIQSWLLCIVLWVMCLRCYISKSGMQRTSFVRPPQECLNDILTSN